MDDDPRIVLELLNSLGFVGITAPQLKGFMKDLKLYRKVKERERQQRKEDITRKIIQKQQAMVQEILHERNCEMQSTTVSSDSNTVEEPWLKLRVTYESEEESDKESECTKENYAPSRREACRKVNSESATVGRNIKPCIKTEREKVDKEKANNKIKSARDKKEPENDNRTVNSNRNTLEPVHIEASSARTQTAASTKSSAQTGSKSFIRPWRLHPEVQSAPRNVKRLDPVALYQKYQKEWKQMPIPGEAKHTAVRWAIRERMLGCDPNPLPVTAKYRISTSRRK